MSFTRTGVRRFEGATQPLLAATLIKAAFLRKIRREIFMFMFAAETLAARH